jgi:hypothetical protein
MYQLQISDDVAEALTAEGLIRLKLSVSSRRLRCAACDVPLDSPRPATSVVVVRHPHLNRMVVRLAHAGCARSEVRSGAIRESRPGSAAHGHEWNLIRRAHPEAPAVLTWEPRWGFDSSVGAVRWPFGFDLIARTLRQSGFSRARGSISRLVPDALCEMTLSRTGGDLVLLRNSSRWLEFSGAAASESSEAWVADAARAGRVLLLYGPGLGGDALANDSLARVLSSGTALCATVRMQGPRASASRGRCGARSPVPVAPAGSVPPRLRGAHKLA